VEPRWGHGELTEVLWSAATAREIVADISRDIDLGRMGRAAGLDLIHRVRERAAPEPDGAASPGRKDPGSPRAVLVGGTGDSMPV
jgi:hypothetical protein